MPSLPLLQELSLICRKSIEQKGYGQARKS
jgi:hypothetical protein